MNSTRNPRRTLAASSPGLNGDKRTASALRNAHALARMGVPVFAARLDRDGNPDTRDKRWQRWEQSPAGEASHNAIDSWKPGEALCAVCGVVFDVLDWDPRNDPDKASWNKLFDGLGDDLPFVFWNVATPRGGRHIWVARMGIGKHTGFLPGLDLQGGKPDGSSRGFVFLPPTSRNGGTYRPTTLLQPYGENSSVGRLREFVLECLGSGLDGTAPSGNGRQEPDALKRAVLTAETGKQRGALLRLVHEYERRGYLPEAIREILRGFLPSVPLFDPDMPWYPAGRRSPDKWINGLLHKPGKGPDPDGTTEELEGIGEPHRQKLTEPFSAVPRRKTQWLVSGFLARGDMTLMDGMKGVTKSLTWEDWCARLSNGAPIPFVPFVNGGGTGEALRTIVFTTEASEETEVGPRLFAAGANLDNIERPKVGKGKRGKATDEWILPDSAPKFARAIRDARADIAIFDPINSFLAEDINTGSEASIRRALGPLGSILREQGCAGWLIRHLNKDRNASPDMRGVGTTGYQNICRVHLFLGRLPEDTTTGAEVGLSILSCNIRKPKPGSVTYAVKDSEYEADDDGGYVPVIEWVGWSAVTAADMLAGSRARRGPDPYAERAAIKIVRELFESQKADRIPAAEISAALEEAGISHNSDLDGRIQDALMLIAVQRRGTRRKEAGAGWDWIRATVHRPRRKG